MRRPRVRIQWLMVVVITAAILSWGVPPLVSEMRRRYANCQRRAARHAIEATTFARWAKGLPHTSEQYPRIKQQADFHKNKAREYREAKYRPWAIWSLGD